MSMKIFALIAMLLFACVTTLAPARSDAPVLGAGEGSVPTLAPFLKRIAPAMVNISVTAEGGVAADAAVDPLMPFLFDWPNANARVLLSHKVTDLLRVGSGGVGGFIFQQEG